MESETQIVQAILKKNEFLLRRHLVLSRTVLDQMKASGLITDVTRRKIMTESAHKQVQLFLKSLEHKGLTSLQKFMDVLRGTGHSWIVDSILDTEVTSGGQAGTKDDIGYSNPPEQSYTRPPAQFSDTNNLRVHRHIQPDMRKSVTAGTANYGDNFDQGLSVASLLKAREPTDPTSAPRGVFNTKHLLTDAVPRGSTYQGLFSDGLPEPPSYSHRNPIPYPRSQDDIPMTLYGLNQAFSDQDQRNQQALSVLQQEAIAIKQLMEQNSRDQGNIRRKQAAVQDIAVRLRDIHNRATEVYGPTPQANIGRYRLAQLNKIPWSING